MNTPLTGSIERSARLHAKQVRQRLLGLTHRRRPRDVLKIGRAAESEIVPERDVIVINPELVPAPAHAPEPIYIAPSAKIINEVAKNHKVSVGEIKGPRRYRYITAARHEAIGRVYTECPHLSLIQIGRIFNRDHTTIMHTLENLGLRERATREATI